MNETVKFAALFLLGTALTHGEFTGCSRESPSAKHGTGGEAPCVTSAPKRRTTFEKNSREAERGKPPPSSIPSVAAAHSAPPSPCPDDMVLVEGDYCPGLAQPCLKLITRGVNRCARFGRSRCLGKTEHRRFCIDRYEYPNRRGVEPVVMVTWYDALRTCESEGKRLCLASEWTFACEGVEGLPYPYGYERDETACNIDRPRPVPEPRFDWFRDPKKAAAEVKRLDRRVPSGSKSRCVSPFGVADMTGNVDEWVLNERHFDAPKDEDHAPPHISGLKGGYWGKVRNACRPITTAHREEFRFYQVGFRCCADARTAPDGRAARYMKRLGPWRARIKRHVRSSHDTSPID